ncbi:MAG: hypothetical protein NTW74_11450 [Acidobacteria bacterium]|nr:hypothetical protein [Acidobacteriota bacterium]
MVISLVLVRAMGPAQFGMVSVGFASSLLLDSVFGSAIDMSVFRLAPLFSKSNSAHARQIEKAGILLKIFGGALIMLPLLAFLSPLSSLLFQDASQGGLLLWTFGALIGLLLIRSLQAHFQVEGRYIHYGVSDFSHTILRFGGIGLLLATLNNIMPSQVMQVYFLAALTVTGAGLIFWARPLLLAPFRMEALSELLVPLRSYLPTIVAGTLASRTDMFFVTSFAGVVEAGIYGAAQMFAIIPQLLGSYVGAVFSPKILTMWQEGKLQKMYPRYQGILLLMAIALYGFVWILTGPFGSILFPEAYSRSSTIVLILLPSGLAAMMNFPLTIPLLLYARPKVLLLIDLISIPLLALTYGLALPGRGAAVAAAICSGWAVLRLLFYQGLALRLLHQDPTGAIWLQTESGKQSLGVASS